MRVFVMTSSPKDIASRCLPVLADSPGIDLAAVVVAQTHTANRRRLLRRRIEKTLKIGFFGALNGLRMRSWYADPEARAIEDVAAEHGVPIVHRSVINSDEMRDAIERLDCDLGISLGNGFIAPSVFRIPRRGMINLHMEVLPRYRGAQSIIWPIHENDPHTGFTLHQIERVIDAGEILEVESFPIEFRESLEATVRHNLARQRERIPDALARCCLEYESRRAVAEPQGSAPSFTTPSFRAFRRMQRNHDRLRAAALLEG